MKLIVARQLGTAQIGSSPVLVIHCDHQEEEQRVKRDKMNIQECFQSREPNVSN